jgi:hypothetical protein
MLVGLPESVMVTNREFFPVDIISPRFSIPSYYLGDKNRPIGDRSSETWPRPIDMIIIIILRNMKMEAIRSSETLLSTYKSTRRYYSEDQLRRVITYLNITNVQETYYLEQWNRQFCLKTLHYWQMKSMMVTTSITMPMAVLTLFLGHRHFPYVTANTYTRNTTVGKTGHKGTKQKSKAVPLHATKALEGRGGIAPTHSWPRH